MHDGSATSKKGGTNNNTRAPGNWNHSANCFESYVIPNCKQELALAILSWPKGNCTSGRSFNLRENMVLSHPSSREPWIFMFVFNNYVCLPDAQEVGPLASILYQSLVWIIRKFVVVFLSLQLPELRNIIWFLLLAWPNKETGRLLLSCISCGSIV